MWTFWTGDNIWLTQSWAAITSQTKLIRKIKHWKTDTDRQRSHLSAFKMFCFTLVSSNFIVNHNNHNKNNILQETQSWADQAGLRPNTRGSTPLFSELTFISRSCIMHAFFSFLYHGWLKATHTLLAPVVTNLCYLPFCAPTAQQINR